MYPTRSNTRLWQEVPGCKNMRTLKSGPSSAKKWPLPVQAAFYNPHLRLLLGDDLKWPQ